MCRAALAPAAATSQSARLESGPNNPNRPHFHMDHLALATWICSSSKQSSYDICLNYLGVAALTIP
jgi:hypothetical protein